MPKPLPKTPPTTRPASQANGADPGCRDGVHPNNTLNELTGRQWLYFTRSALTTAYPHAHGHDLRKAHGANKPPALIAELIAYFTKPGATVLDPFAGVGGTLLAAGLTGRRAAGIEINPTWRALYRRVARREGLPVFPVLAGDCRVVLARWGRRAPQGFERVDFVCADPPYNLNFTRTMCGLGGHPNRRSDFTGFSPLPGDLANLADYPAFTAAMSDILTRLTTVIRPGGYLALMVRNAYQAGRYRLVHADLAAAAETAGWTLKGEKVWYQAGTRLRPYGYPRLYVPNISHQHILFFRYEA